MKKEEKEQQDRTIKMLEETNKLIDKARKHNKLYRLLQNILTILIALVIATGSIYLIIFFIRKIFRI
jgi:hypothetical protein